MGGLFFVPMVGLLGILIAWYRRDPQRFLDGPTEDAPLRLTRWAIGLLAPQRAEWGSGYARRTRPHQGPGPADALRARLRRRCARSATVGSGRRRCAGDDRARGRQCRPVRLGGRPLPARPRRPDRGPDPD